MATIEVRTGPLAYVEQQLEMLSPRDRRLLVGLVLFFAVVFIGGYWYFLNGMLNDKAARVRDAKQALVVVNELDTELRKHRETFKQQEARLREYSKQPVSPWIEGLATKHTIIEQLRSVNEVASEPVSAVVKRTTYTVEFKRAPQEQLYRFLYDLETSSFPASVEEAIFDVSYLKKEKFMDLSLELAVLSLTEGT